MVAKKMQEDCSRKEAKGEEISASKRHCFQLSNIKPRFRNKLRVKMYKLSGCQGGVSVLLNP